MRLYVNVDHVATIREARRADEPDPVAAAVACLRGGADGITVHLREDRRHIQDDDVTRLADCDGMVLNLELATASDIVDLAARLRPMQVTLVPEKRQEVTTEGGLDLTVHRGRPHPALSAAIDRLSQLGIRVSLFIDPDPRAIEASIELGVPAVELHTGDYANSWTDPSRATGALDRLRLATHLAREGGLAVHAGHGLTYRNVTSVAALPDIEELNIGHSIVSRSVLVGIETAVRDMRELVDSAR